MKKNLNIFLLIGQSNMAGRGRLSEVPAIKDAQIFMFRDACWCPAEEPLHCDKPGAGIGLGMSFAAELLSREPGNPVGLIPCAVGGTSLNQWMPGTDLYKNAVSVTQAALSPGKLQGILWHQGEGDSGKLEDAESYSERFQKMIACMRTELHAEKTPVIAGELGQFLIHNDSCNFFSIINLQLNNLEQTLPNYGCASSDELTDNGDKAHFNSNSLRKFGYRYAEKYFELKLRINKTK